MPFKITLLVISFFNLLALIFLINLIVFHIELKFKGMTTYEYLKMKESALGKESKIVKKITEKMPDRIIDASWK